MSTGTGTRTANRATIRRRRSLALLALVGVVAIATVAIKRGGGSPPPPLMAPKFVRLELGGSTLARLNVAAAGHSAAVDAALRRVPSHRLARAGGARITYAVDRAGAATALRRAMAKGGGIARVPERAVSSSIAVPLIAQQLQDDCEATAAAMVLGYTGHPVDQLSLQRQLAHAKPLDPIFTANGEIWGDPSLGFVGRADGGGPAGGFGVYQRPVRALFRKHGIAMSDLTGGRPARVYAALLSGHPVLAWIALSAGPYASWTSPAGRAIRVNYGEHAVVLTGVSPADVKVNDPLSGERLTWSKEEFESMWAGLGRRALAAPAHT